LNGEDVMTTLLKTDNELDNELCEKACRLGGHATQAEAIHNALEKYLDYLQLQTSAEGKQPEEIQSVIDLFGKIDYYDDYDYIKQRYLR
jgi:hypothetical protein